MTMDIFACCEKRAEVERVQIEFLRKNLIGKLISYRARINK